MEGTEGQSQQENNDSLSPIIYASRCGVAQLPTTENGLKKITRKTPSKMEIRNDGLPTTSL